MKRRVSAILVVVCLLFSISTVCYAAEESNVHNSMSGGESGIEPYYVNTANIVAGLKIEGMTAHCYSEVFAKKVCYINVILQLQRKEGGSWVNKISWVASETSGGKVMSKSYDLFERGSYRVNVIATVGGEKVTCTSATKTY